MPFARVGAMPQPSSNKQRNVQRKGALSSSSKQKGITMEDLKKQTALRLAQEQQQKQGYMPDTDRNRPLQPLGEHQFPPSGQPPHPVVPGHAAGRYGYAGPRVGVSPSTAEVPNQGYQCPNPPQVAHFNQTGPFNGHGHPTAAAPYDYTENRQLSPRSMQNQNHVRHEDMDGSIKIQYQPPEYSPHGSVQRPPGSSVRGSELRSTGASKQKLPHGLTVHELKEMTKARLQAEAADKPVEQTENEDNRRLSPLDFDSVPEVRERASSRDSGLNNNGTFLSHGPGSTNSIPSMVQVSQQPRDPNFERQPQVSPLPAGFQSSSSGGSAFHQPRVDVSESVSVASHNSAAVSENYGSESMYSGGPSSGYGPSNESEFQYGIGSGFAGHQAPLSAHASPSDGNSYYDTSIGGNRRRAITLSPRGISIHEDRPIHGGLRMPNFTSASRATLSSRPSRNFSPVLGLGLDDAFLGQNVGLAPLGGTDLNRPRTSSATSLPIRSHDGLDFNRDRANTFNGFSTGQPRDDGLSESVSNALTDSFLRVSGNESRRAMNRNFGFSDGVSAPPGFTSNSNSRSSTAGNFAALAAGGSFGNRQDPWEDAARSSPLFTADGVDDMADSMGSILKLSGVGSDRPDRERSHTYPYGAFH